MNKCKNSKIDNFIVEEYVWWTNILHSTTTYYVSKARLKSIYEKEIMTTVKDVLKMQGLSDGEKIHVTSQKSR